MDLSDLLEPERIRCHCDVKSKKRTLQTLAELLGESLRSGKQSALTACAGDDSTESGNTQYPANGKAENGQSAKSNKKSGIVNKVRKSVDKSDAEADTLTDMEILDALISRERLGSTGLGHGVAPATQSVVQHSRAHSGICDTGEWRGLRVRRW